MNRIYGLFAVLLLAVAPFTFAQGSEAAPAKAARGEALDARFAHLTCAVDLSKAHLDIVGKYLEKDVGSLKDGLDSALSAAKDASSEADVKKFGDAQKKVLDAIKSAKAFIVDSRKGSKPKGDQAKASREEGKNAQEAYTACQSSAMKGSAEKEVKKAEGAIANLQKEADDLKAKGADVSALQSAIDAAIEQKDALKQAAETGDSKAVAGALKQWRNRELHVRANMVMTRLRAVIAKAEEKAQEKGITLDLSEAKEALDKVEALAKPGKEYAEGEFEKVWSSLKEAAEKIKSGAKKAAKEEKKAEIQAKKEEKKAETQAKKEEKKAEMQAEKEEDEDAAKGAGKSSEVKGSGKASSGSEDGGE